MEYEFVEAYRSLNKDKEAERPIIFYNFKYSYSSTNKTGKYYRCICRVFVCVVKVQIYINR